MRGGINPPRMLSVFYSLNKPYFAFGLFALFLIKGANTHMYVKLDMLNVDLIA